MRRCKRLPGGIVGGPPGHHLAIGLDTGIALGRQAR